ncbi:hypothetical protein [Cohnella cholangitidis]|uniref:P27 family phage terminase small subunit n=1 Tax=Cohnella cholangitidis TaxID=2598458 RepID=A0A7G5C3E9_9BACL|nr:hypothetical protein [Cohnella cholangitidis]QMV43733.1 P27 family phage terminase small subunit [Cohnella cholangitidis]
MAISSGPSREERIKREFNRLKRLLKDIPKEKYSAAEGIVRRVSFMAITLEDLEVDINASGAVEEFTQGDNSYERARPSVQIYNTTVKNYATACKQLTDLVPEGKPKVNPVLDPFQQIMARGQSG